METTYERFLLNLKGGIRRETFQGRKYVVAPAVLLTEDVHNGSHGPTFYPATQLEKSVPSWNLKPVVLYHPELNGEPISAASPTVLESRGLGFALNSSWNKGLGTEIWFDEVKTKEVEKKLKMNPGLLQRLETGDTIELSTGLSADLDGISGYHNGQFYKATALNYRPDHIAILPDRIGACSVQKGCGCGGVVRNEAKKPEEIQEQKFLTLALSHQDIGRRIHKAMMDEAGPDKYPGYVEDVFDDGFIYSSLDGKMYHRSYTIDSNSLKVSLGDKPQEVLSHKAYKTVDGKSISKAFSLNQEGVISMADPVTTTQPPAVPTTTTPPPATLNPENPAKGPALLKNELSVEEYINNAPPTIRDMLNEGLASYNAERDQLISEIVANKANIFRPEDLAKRPLVEIRAIAALARGNVQPPQQVHNRGYYGGSNPPPPAPQTPKIKPLATPAIDWSKTQPVRN